ncbi:hypothetical protein CXK98_16250 [Stutzerimonas kunmingensis]|nr:hypothetical protein CXK98_16250 [Stutzerimonas kunmingensis]
MVPRYKPSHNWAVKLSEAAAQQQMVASSYVLHWKEALEAIKQEHAELIALDDAQKEVICHVFAAVRELGKLPMLEMGLPDDDEIVSNYLYGRGKVRYFISPFPHRYLSVGAIHDEEFEQRFNVRTRLRLIEQLNEVKAKPAANGFFGDHFNAAFKQKKIASLEYQVAVNSTICRLLERGVGVDMVRLEYQNLFRRYRHASDQLLAAQARGAAEKEARRLLSGRGKTK